MIVPKVLGVLRAQERALMMVEPPGEPRVGRILEIDDGIHIAIEKPILKELGRFVSQAGEFKIGAWSVFIAVKTAKVSRRGSTVETVVVIENSHPHEFMSLKRGKLSSLPYLRG
jgi:large-conductance mechanosensitive channel